MNFIEAKYNEKQPVTNLNFAKFTNGMSDDNPESAKKKIKKNVIPTFVNDDDSEEELVILIQYLTMLMKVMQ